MKLKHRLFRLIFGTEVVNTMYRDEWIEKQLKMIPEGSSILDAGAGEMPYKKFCNHLKYISQDFCEYTGGGDYDYGAQTGTWNTEGIDIVGDIINIPVEDESFDVILCTEVLEHIPYPDRAIKEFARILKPGGKLILTAPFGGGTHFAPYHFCTGFNIFWFERHFTDNGLKIVEKEQNGSCYSRLNAEIYRIMTQRDKVLNIPLVIGGRLFRMSLKRYDIYGLNESDYWCDGWHILGEKNDKI